MGTLIIVFSPVIIMESTSRKKTLRNGNSRLNVLQSSPGEKHLEISGNKLPTYEQVLLSYMATMEKMRSQDPTKNSKLTNVVLNTVYQKVLVHYKKANIPTKHYSGCGERQEYDSEPKIDKHQIKTMVLKA